MTSKQAKNFRNQSGLKLFMAPVLVLLLSATGMAHDLGISSMSLNFTDGNLVIYSSYAKGDFAEFLTPGDYSKIEGLAKTAITLEVDGQLLTPEASEAYGDNTDGLNFRHEYENVTGTEIKVISQVLSKLSDNHTQILTVIRRDEREVARKFLTNDSMEFVFNLENVQTPSSFGQFLSLGIKHITLGFDHILFLLALLLVVTQTRQVLGIVTFFTIAHSITLSLVALNFLSVPGWIVEPIIAISIIYVGIENLVSKEYKHRWLVAYAFGLVHGLGFATILRDIGIGEGLSAISPLVSFNLGVEIGQIAIVLLVLPVLWKLQKTTVYTNRIVPIGSILITIAGIYWLVERTLL